MQYKILAVQSTSVGKYPEEGATDRGGRFLTPGSGTDDDFAHHSVVLVFLSARETDTLRGSFSASCYIRHCGYRQQSSHVSVVDGWPISFYSHRGLPEWIFFTALVRYMPSSCVSSLSVCFCLTLTRRDCIKTAELRMTQTRIHSPKQSRF